MELANGFKILLYSISIQNSWFEMINANVIYLAIFILVLIFLGYFAYKFRYERDEAENKLRFNRHVTGTLYGKQVFLTVKDQHKRYVFVDEGFESFAKSNSDNIIGHSVDELDVSAVFKKLCNEVDDQIIGGKEASSYSQITINNQVLQIQKRLFKMTDPNEIYLLTIATEAKGGW